MAISFSAEEYAHPREDKTGVYVNVTTTGGTTSGSFTLPAQLDSLERVIGACSWSIATRTVSIANIPGNGTFSLELIGTGL